MQPLTRQGNPVRILAVVLASLVFTGCGGDGEVESNAPAAIAVTSPAFRPNEPIPATYTCRGSELSPPLTWTGVPDEAREIAVVVDDPDAPSGTYVHWILFHLPPSTSSLAEASVPPGARQAKNSAGHAEYDGPCPPSGSHHYRFTVYALDARLGLDDGADTDEAVSAIGDRAIAQGRLVGVFTAD
jgi:Raf kinase inhibitor-like YbhB/YbcL family protein